MLFLYWTCVADSDKALNQLKVKSMCLLGTLEELKCASSSCASALMRKYLRKCARTQVRKYFRKCASAQVFAEVFARVHECASARVRKYASMQVLAQVCKSTQVLAQVLAQVREYVSAQVSKYGTTQVRMYTSAQMRRFASR